MIIDPAELEPDRHRAILLFSGGFDSTFCAYLLKQRRVQTILLTIDYPSRPAVESRVCSEVAERLSLDVLHVALGLSDNRNRPEAWSSAEHEGWFPYRNSIFSSIAAHVATRHAFNLICAGVRASDGAHYDDATLEFFRRLESMLIYSGDVSATGPVEFLLPLVTSDHLMARCYNDDDECRRLLNATRSCWRDGPAPCGECEACKSRIEFLSKIRE
jgi:7-cyano-7-deazaguanine synthase in queuosine biosynthesis